MKYSCLDDTHNLHSFNKKQARASGNRRRCDIKNEKERLWVKIDIGQGQVSQKN